jgi:hypothetical protein
MTALRLPAYGREIAGALAAGLRPRLGNTIAVVTAWDLQTPLERVVCPATEDADTWSFDFLTGQDVVVLAPERDQIHAERLGARIRSAGASCVYVGIHHDDVGGAL